MVKHIGIFCKGVDHNCFNPLQQPSYCSPDLLKKRFYEAKFQNVYDIFLKVPTVILGPGAPRCLIKKLLTIKNRRNNTFKKIKSHTTL